VTSKETISFIREAVSNVQEKGGDSISAERLQQFLNHLDSEQVDKDIGMLFSAKKDTALAKYRIQADLVLENFKSVIVSGQAALKSMFLINGGAAVAILALIGHLSTSEISAAKVGKFAIPLSCFALGLVFTTTAAGFTYLAQRAYSKRGKGRRHGNRLNAIIVLLSIASLLAFMVGCAFTYTSIQGVGRSNVRSTHKLPSQGLTKTNAYC